jgi:hypothetical protein
MPEKRLQRTRDNYARSNIITINGVDITPSSSAFGESWASSLPAGLTRTGEVTVSGTWDDIAPPQSITLCRDCSEAIGRAMRGVSITDEGFTANVGGWNDIERGEH